ncbi:hypothetical protein FQZ97_749970 [compost metagenome]
MTQQGQLVRGENGLHVLRDHARAVRAVGCVVHAHQVFLFNAAVLADELARDAAVLREHEQAHGVDVEPAAGREAAGVFGGEAAAVRRVAGIATPLAGRADQRGGGFVAVFGLAAHVAHGLVQQDRHLPGLLVARLGQHLHVGVGRHGHAHDSRLAVDQHPAARDPFVGLAARAQAEVGHAFVEPHFAAHVADAGEVGPVRLHRARCGGQATLRAVASAVGCVARVRTARYRALAPAALVTARCGCGARARAVAGGTGAGGSVAARPVGPVARALGAFALGAGSLGAVAG